jgi:hypothetical protein
MKHYIAAANNENTFLAIKRRSSSLVLGVSFPSDSEFPLQEENPQIFKWSRMTKAFAIAKPDDVNDATLSVLKQSAQYAASESNTHKAYFGVTLKQLLNADLAQPGETLLLLKGANEFAQATLLPDGRIQWNGALYHSPSDKDFAKAIGRKSINGWTHWFVKRDGSLLSLAALRQMLGEASQNSGTALTEIEE